MKQTVILNLRDISQIVAEQLKIENLLKSTISVVDDEGNKIKDGTNLNTKDLKIKIEYITVRR